MTNKKRLVKLIQDLIRIDSQNPPGNEAKIAGFLRDYLHKIGLKVKLVEFKKGRTNVIGLLNGGAGHSLLLTPHLDTVPAGKNWRFPPFAGRVYKNKIYGLGATDCKGNLACALEAINCLVEQKIKLDYNLIFAATADEESGSTHGLIPLLNKGILRPDAAIVLDADDFEIIVAQKGLLHFKLKIIGKRAHGAYPWLGANAISMAAAIIEGLRNKKYAFRKNKYLHPPTLNIGTIKGGDKVNVVADWCEIEMDHRFLPGSRAKDFLKEVKKIAAKFTRKFSIEVDGIQAPYQIKEAHPLVKYLKQAADKFRASPKVRGSEGATVITFFQDKKIPAVATGFGCGGCAHTINEHAKIDNLYKGARVLEEFLKIYQPVNN
ncbi:MAG: M20 family metallopeptidase [Candidatus Omnitrophota bacterium]|nr:M20 family metallopeptidase [Candidatus Omnitrophota bacterium]MBU1928297.1 M20 family metallopeptidase [Candidatus Omnitrophota bacterium]MBU2035547.1 M20 family metallopeptidase [Candidatus Omnitrophota bacterium]MBU2222010.1 M20 family metallopeptidase [Candidatus Omnitrophota bacterium]MBU2257555.1 M20 family metallopeptidase [Candidatus Omnitrophota bacterium]